MVSFERKILADFIGSYVNITPEIFLRKKGLTLFFKLVYFTKYFELFNNFPKDLS